MSSIWWIVLILWPEKQLQTIILTPPCMTVALQYIGFSISPFGRRTCLIPSQYLKLYLDSSGNSTVFHFWILQTRWALANSSLAFLLLAAMKGFFAARRLNNPTSTAFLRIVLSLIFKDKLFLIWPDDVVYWSRNLHKVMFYMDVLRSAPVISSLSAKILK